jgi:hypothetical protein
MTTKGNNNKTLSGNGQSNNQNHPSLGNNQAQNPNDLHHAIQQAISAPTMAASIPVHGVMYAANSVGTNIESGQVFNLAQNGNVGGINAGDTNVTPVVNPLAGATQYSATNPAPITSENIQTFFPFTPAPETHGNVINPEVVLPNTQVGPAFLFADNVESILSTSAPIASRLTMHLKERYILHHNLPQ